jgi:hypothetical protein
MSFITIIFFFIYTVGLGFTATFFLKNSDNFLERNLMRIGIGLGFFVVLGTLLSLLHIPLDYRIFLIASVIAPIIMIFKIEPKFSFKLTKSNLVILIVLLIFSATFYMYTTGAFKYPYLEDDDPWAHTMSVKYIAVEETANAPKNFGFKYLDPYPPGFGILMAMLHQTSPSLSWTLKFFNALILSFNIIFFYFFTKNFLNSRNKALFSTFVLAAIPSFFSHFIWAVSLSITLFLPAMYCLEMTKHDKRWGIPAALVIAAIFLSQPTSAIKLGIMFALYWLVRVVMEKKALLHILFTEIGGLLLSLLLWWIPKLLTGGLAYYFDLAANPIVGGERTKTGLFKIIGTADRLYNLNDFFIAKAQNMINVPIGIGFVVSLLGLISVIYSIVSYKQLLKKPWLIITLCWLLFTFIGIHGERLPIQFIAFRFWILFAIPLALICSEGMWWLADLSKKVKFDKIFLFTIVLLGILFTSASQKYAVNTAQWGPGVSWASMEELVGYSSSLPGLPPNTKVFSFGYDALLFGFDKYTCAWCDDVVEFKESGFNQSSSFIHSWLAGRGYQYIVLSAGDIKKFGLNEANAKMQEIATSGLFSIAYQNQGMVLFKV